MMKQKKLAILHYMPVEGYPPVVNLIQYAAQLNRFHLFCLTTQGGHPLKTNVPQCKILRMGYIGQRGLIGRLKLLYSYVSYNFIGLLILLIKRPDCILYYETLSAFPALIYKWLFPSTQLLIHYHEYTSPQEYRNGMKQVRWIHHLEKKMYPHASWLSHTNEYRMQLFTQHHPTVRPETLKILPNYPPKSWLQHSHPQPKFNAPYKLVYVGALSTETMFLKEIAEWVENQAPLFTLDLYSFSIDHPTQQYLNELNTSVVSYKGTVSQNEFPQIISQYHIGLILYKGHIPNYTYIAPNKLFEYFACGLDVWFPKQMIGSITYVTHGTYPKISDIDYTQLSNINIDKLLNEAKDKYQPSSYFYESEYQKLTDSMSI